MFKFNKDVKKRDEIIFGEYKPEEYFGGVRYFKNLTLDTLKKLIDLKFMDPEEQSNSCPSIQEFVDFMENNEDYTVNGFTVSIDRDDYRVEIDAIEKNGSLSKNELRDFVYFIRYADERELTESSAYAWWD